MQANSDSEIVKLLENCKKSKALNDWESLENQAIEGLRRATRVSINERDTKSLIVAYLSSLVGSGEFITNLSSEVPARYELGIQKLERFINMQPKFKSGSKELIDSAREVSLLLSNISAPVFAQYTNKIAANLRNMGRPDLSLPLCVKVLDLSQYNYYALTILCSSLTDLNRFDDAVNAGEKALSLYPKDVRKYPLNALSRTYTRRFKATGDLEDIEKALDYAKQSIGIQVDQYSANTYISAAVASLDENEIANASRILQEAEPDLKSADIEALVSAHKLLVKENKEQLQEQVDLTTDNYFPPLEDFDTLIDMVQRYEAFKPILPDDPLIISRFSSGGWFTQDSHHVQCPKCGRESVVILRKHFERYNKAMHYWGIVCTNCKTAGDSTCFTKDEFKKVKMQTEEESNVEVHCSACWIKS
jgi:tetratricopeptide (TPR) repeat protein